MGLGLLTPSPRKSNKETRKSSKETRKSATCPHPSGTRMSCVRITLLLSNLLMAVLGLLLVAGGAWLIVSEGSAEEVAQAILNDANVVDAIRKVDNLEGALQEMVKHPWFNYAVIGIGVLTFIVSLAGFCGAKLESTCLLSTYSVFILLLIFLQLSAIVLINARDDDDIIKQVKTTLETEADKIDLDVDRLKAGDKVMQTVFFGVSAALSTLLFVITTVLCCRVRRDERVQGYVNSVNA